MCSLVALVQGGKRTWVDARKREDKLGTALARLGAMDATGLLLSKICLSLGRCGRLERADIALSERSRASSWFLVTPKFSMAGMLRPDREPQTKQGTANTAEQGKGKDKASIQQ